MRNVGVLTGWSKGGSKGGSEPWKMGRLRRKVGLGQQRRVWGGYGEGGYGCGVKAGRICSGCYECRDCIGSWQRWVEGVVAAGGGRSGVRLF